MLERLRVGPLYVNAYILRTEESCVLVDPGDDPAATLSFLDARGLTPSIIAATHGHLDHTAAIPALLATWRSRGREVPVAAHAADAAYYGESAEATNRALFASTGGLEYFEAFWGGAPLASIFLEEGDVVPGTELRVILTPGHSPGSICLYDGAAGTLISGDTLFRDGVGRTDFLDSNPALLEESLARILELPPKTRVLPGHGPETTIERERRYRPGSIA
jgi:glyoxylase-like metal-dependent hydrolase (beta-lactamase superfamily II)